MFNGFYQNKRVLVIGHTGFKGSWLSLWLHKLGAIVSGLSLPAPTDPNLHEIIRKSAFSEEIQCDIRDQNAVSQAIRASNPQVIFHLAAQPIVRRSYHDPLETLQTNAMGTAHILESVRLAKLNCVLLVVTSDKCYENREWDYAYRENDPLGGHDIYSMSKAATELIAQAWARSFFVPDPKLGPVATVRAGNVIGGGDYALDRIIPDCVRGLTEGKALTVRNPAAVRPWQHVLECLSGYLWLAALLGAQGKQSRLATPFNFGPDPSSRQPVRALIDEAFKTWPGKWVDASDPNSPHEATLLTLAIDKAAALLDWRPVWNFSEAVRQTMTWYHERHLVKNPDMLEYSGSQIDAYVTTARQGGLKWAV